MAAIRKIQKNGGSLNINLPSQICDQLDVHLGDEIVFVLHEGGWCAFAKIELKKNPDMRELTEAGSPIINYGK